MEHILFKLANRYPQLYLPITEGIRQSEEYRNVVLRGEKSNRELLFNFDQRDKFETVKTIAGDVEVLTLYNREDFVHAAICLGHKCEPTIIPDSTGAMAIFGLNNWDKVRAGQENYKDSLIILSSGNYSNVNVEDINTYIAIRFTKEEWTTKSITIRKYHELTHFIMRKLYPEDINFIRDELIADACGLFATFNSFDPRFLRLFLGIENSTYRKGGRLENYEGGQVENIPTINKMIDELEIKINKYKTIEDIFNNIKELM